MEIKEIKVARIRYWIGIKNALKNKIVLDYITKCECGGEIKRIDGGRMCELCFKTY